jgi:hypothetical protein
VAWEGDCNGQLYVRTLLGTMANQTHLRLIILELSVILLSDPYRKVSLEAKIRVSLFFLPRVFDFDFSATRYNLDGPSRLRASQ